MRLSRVSNASGLCLIFFISDNFPVAAQVWDVQDVTSAQLDCCNRLPVSEDHFLLRAGGTGLSGFATPIGSTLALSGLWWFSS